MSENGVKTEGRKIESLNEVQSVRMRTSMFLGDKSTRLTIAMKEIIDNEIDVVAEKGQAATQATINISPHHLQVMDNGNGISAKIKDNSSNPLDTYLYLACAKLFTSSNYGGVQDTVGANGVGLTVSNFTSHKFTILNVKEETRGYSFTDGELHKDSKFTGDIAISGKEAFSHFNLPYDYGFYVDINWDPTPNEIFSTPADIKWLLNYAKVRIGELGYTASVKINVYSDDEFKNEESSNSFVKSKVKAERGLGEYVPNWFERVREFNDEDYSLSINRGNFKFAFYKDTVKHPIQSIVQSAPVDNSNYLQYRFEFENNEFVSMQIPYSFIYLGNDYPDYTDQTKRSINNPREYAVKAFKGVKMYEYFYQQAQKIYIQRQLKGINNDAFYPCTGDDNTELIISEGYSAISSIVANRDSKTQACLPLRGKILNCWRTDYKFAIRSEIVKLLLSTINTKKYEKIIIATDADDDGAHIATLLIGLFAQYTNLIQEKKVYRVYTPHFIFVSKDKTEPMEWSEDPNDVKPGWHVRVNKGLGSLEPKSIKQFIVDKESRILQRIIFDEHAEDSLDLALYRGGKDWVDKV